MSQTTESAGEKLSSDDGDGPSCDAGQPEFEDLLHSSALDTLADFDFSCEDFGGIEPEVKTIPTASLAGGRRCGNNSQGWESLAPKALSELNLTSAVLSGAWESAVAMASSSSNGGSLGGVGDGCAQGRKSFVGEVSSASNSQNASPDPRSENTAPLLEDNRGKSLRGRRVANGTKRPLNPDRMERKANREKRRREEVNEKFEQLLRVLEEAEATSDLKPPPSEVGQQVGACVNGRRVEVLSRTIWILKKLLHDRKAGLTTTLGAAHEAADVTPTPHSLTATAIPEAAAIADSASPPVFEASQSGSVAPVHASSSTSAASTAPASAGGASAHPVHVAVPMHGHPTMVLPQSFAMPNGLQSTLPGMPQGMPNQPFFIAVPMYMPSQGMGPCGSETSSAGTPGQVMMAQPSAAVNQLELPEESKPSPAAVPDGSEGTSKNGSGCGGLPQVMTLQIPQFVARALSAEDGTEKLTHAMCA